MTGLLTLQHPLREKEIQRKKSEMIGQAEKQRERIETLTLFKERIETESQLS